MSSQPKFVTYVKDALTPGGTPSRYLIWVEVILALQTLASVLPSHDFLLPGWHMSEYILAAVGVVLIASNFARTDGQRILIAYGLYVVGLAVTTFTISMGITSLSGIVFLLTWAMTLFISERREYISFDLVTLFMVLMLVSAVILLMFNPKEGVAENWLILATGAVLTSIDIYLVYIDFGSKRNFYQESRKSFANLDILSTKLSDILTRQGNLDELLWEVTEECVPFLELEECVIYLFDEDEQVLRQVAAYGRKSTADKRIVDPITIEPGKGIVGKTFATGEPILIEEIKKNSDYIVDDAVRSSELAMPIICDGKPIGVIDSEHTKNGFFKDRHEQAFRVMASFCGIKITEHRAKESMQQAERVQMEASHYKELDQMKNRFITNISHDLKTPLSLIKAPAIQIQNLATDERIKKHSNYILKNTEHLLRVVGQLLQLNRVDKGLNELYLEEIDARALINKIGGQYKGLAEKENVQFTYESVDASLITDAFRLQQIIHNLVHNAFRYTGTNGRVRLVGAIEKNDFIIRVEDNGPGISEKIQKQVFERFFKVDENNHEGTGIGLSLVKEYTDSLNGQVHLESAEGKGTTFIVTIPFSVSEVAQEQPGVEAQAEDESKPVMLVVEDHADLNDFICTFFEDDFLCISAFDGAQALKEMERHIPDIIISDLMMPELDGNAFIQRVKSNENFEHIPVVVLSAKSQVESRVDLYEIGADNYLTKPFDVSELGAIVHNIMEQRKKLRNRLHSTLDSIEQSEAKVEKSTEETQFLESVRVYVVEHLDDSSLSIPEMAKALGYGRNKFQKHMRETAGVSPVEFIRSVRLLEAKTMLQQSGLSISEVAYAVGFNNLSYFTRSFKNEFGMLPSDAQNSEVSSKT